MAKLGWLILGLLVLWAHPSHATMTQCPDGAHWYNSSDGVSACPDSFTVTGASASTTSVTLTGSVDEASGTVHSTIRLNCTLLQWRNTTQGTGAEASADDTDVSSGAFSINVTGLAESTTYCAHLVQYTNNRATVQKTIQFTTLDSTPSVSGDEITGGDDRFYCPDGNDANSGLTNALRKANYPQTDTSVLSGGDDMWFCTGGVWLDRPMDIARQGTSGNWNEHGTYYMDGATPRKAVDGVLGPGTTHTKAMIKGHLTDACLAAGTCIYPSSGFPVNGLTSKYDGLVILSSTADYSSFLNIEISYSQYNSMTASGTGTEGSLHHLIFDGTDMKYNGQGARLTFVDGVTDIVVRNVDSYQQNTCMQIRGGGKSSDVSSCATQPWSGTLVTIVRNSGKALVEWNTSRRGMGEGYNCYNNSTGKVIFRNNYSVNSWSDGVYLDGCQDVVVEANIILGGDADHAHSNNNGPTFTGVHLGCESTSYPDSTGHVVRNNLLVGARRGLEGNFFTACATAGEQIGGKFYNNTTIASTNLTGTDTEYEMLLAEVSANVAEWVATNNVHWNESLGTAICSSTSAGTYADNHWYTNPADNDCDGSGDTYGDPGLTLSTYASWAALAAVNGDDPVTWPTWSQANPAGGSGLIGTGTALTSTILDKDTYGFAYEQIREVLAGTLTEAEWECANCVDAEGTTRANPPSKGAVE